jgi:SpoVK/Ycf46/Vps4 family AAA+-type ATPase
MSNEGKFTIKKKTSFEELKNGSVIDLVESDLCFQDGENIYQFAFEKATDLRKLEISPGTFALVSTQMGVDTSPLEFKKRNLLESVSNTSLIINEARKFFSRLHIYEELDRPKKRGVLLYSSPGCGKTSAIEKVCSDLLKEDPGTVVMVWPTSKIEADDIVKFLTTNSEYTTACTRLILIIEDIGGGETEGKPTRSGVDSGLLSLLDGVGVTFRLPTFIIATTNYPQNLLSSLADRPGRFDLMVKLEPPSYKEKVQLMEFICKRQLSDSEKNCLSIKGTEDFSIAHLEEIAIRSKLDDKTHMQVVDEIIEHKKLFARDFEDKDKRMGVGFSFNDDD